MTQLVPRCISSVTSFTSPATTLPGLARLKRKLLPSQTFLAHLCHCRVWTVVGNPKIAVHDGSGQGGVSPTQLCKQMLLCWTWHTPQGMESTSCKLSMQGIMRSPDQLQTLFMWLCCLTHLCTHGSASSFCFYSGWKEFIEFFGIADRIWAKSFLHASYYLSFIHQIPLFQVIFLCFKSVPL